MNDTHDGEWVRTGDGSPTFHSNEYGEDYHSRSGAWLEARERYVEPCRIVSLAREGRVRFLDVGFGLGWNLAWALLAALEANGEAQIEVVSLEQNLISWPRLAPLYSDFPASGVGRLVGQLVEQKRVEEGGISLQLVLGKAEQEISGIDAEFDAIFLDPFSPPRNPELWEPGFLREVRERTRAGGVLSTYSAATRVKVALLQAGWLVGPGPRVGAKSSGTLATHNVIVGSDEDPSDLPFARFPQREERRLLRRAGLLPADESPGGRETAPGAD